MTENFFNFIRKVIESEVYTLQEKERFIPENVQWLMDFRRSFMRAEVLDAYAELFYERFERDWPFQIGGAEVAAIPLVTAIALKMRAKGKPVNAFFVRKSRKKTGLLRMIEGKVTKEPVILVDDLINSGGTFERQILAVEEAGAKVSCVFVLLRFRPMEHYTELQKKGVKIESLFTLDDFQESLGVSMKQIIDVKPVPKVFTTLWRFQSPDPKLEWVQPKSGIAQDRENIYFGSDRGILWALRKRDGTAVWKHQIGLWPKGVEIFSTPVLSEGRIYFGARDGNIYCFDAKTGKQLWVSFEADIVDGGIRVLPKYKMLIVPAQFGLWKHQGGIVALDLVTGKKLWECIVPDAITGTLVYLSKRDTILAGSRGGIIYCLERKTGRILWGFAAIGSIPEGGVLTEDQEMFLAASMDGSVYAIETRNGALRWRYEVGVANYSSPYISNSKVYVASLDKSIYCLNLASGKKIWSFATRSRIFASPRIYNDRLYIGSNDARLYELDPETGKETGYFQVTERITNPLYYDPDTGLFYLVTYANEVYCLRWSTETDLKG